MKNFIKEWAWQVLTGLFLLLFLGKGCTHTKIIKHDKDMNVNNSALIHKIDSLENRIISLEQNAATKKEIQDEMEQTMLEFLIYEDDLDKGKISLSLIKNKIEEND